MATAKIFENGRSQAVRLPKEYRFKENEIIINKIGDIVLLMPKNDEWKAFKQSLDLFSDDFMADGRSQNNNETRESLWNIC